MQLKRESTHSSKVEHVTSKMAFEKILTLFSDFIKMFFQIIIKKCMKILMTSFFKIYFPILFLLTFSIKTIFILFSIFVGSALYRIRDYK